MTKKNIVLFYGGPSSEHEVSINTAKSMAQHINRELYDVLYLYMQKDRQVVLYSGEFHEFDKQRAEDLFEVLNRLASQDIYRFLLATHGEFGEDGRLQTILGYYGYSYTGSKAMASNLCMDKFRAAAVIGQYIKDVKTPKTWILSQDLAPEKFPLILKPNTLGSSVGLRKVLSQKELTSSVEWASKNFPGVEFVVQEFIENTVEVSCGCLQQKDGSFIKLPPVEIIPQSSTLYDYNAKYSTGGSIHKCPPEGISRDIQEKISELSCRIHQELGCVTYSRSDFLIKGEDIYYLETNTLPGMTQTSLVPDEAKAINMQFSDLISFIIENS